jgi:hypothetical protein
VALGYFFSSSESLLPVSFILFVIAAWKTAEEIRAKAYTRSRIEVEGKKERKKERNGKMPQSGTGKADTYTVGFVYVAGIISF